MKILITGGAGFIGSALIRYILSQTVHSVVNVDLMTYAANESAIGEFDVDRYQLEIVDIRDPEALRRVFEIYSPDGVIHLAAESHVDRSIDAPEDFLTTNVLGTYHLLQTARAHFEGLNSVSRDHFRFHHVSTDEVFGQLNAGDRPFNEHTPYSPSSPYSSTKAASDHIAKAWSYTFDLPVILTNCSNNYGPWQFPEKLIPMMITNAVLGEALPIYGDGSNVRDWLHVDDHARALWTAFTKGKPGETYLVGGNAEHSNLDVVLMICGIMDDLRGGTHAELISFVTDRPGHDFRYAINADKIRKELGWSPGTKFEKGLRDTVLWYLKHREWWENIRNRRYDGRRLGQARK